MQFAPKEMCSKYYIIEQILVSLHEIQLYKGRLISLHGTFNFPTQEIQLFL